MWRVGLFMFLLHAPPSNRNTKKTKEQNTKGLQSELHVNKTAKDKNN